MSQTDQTSYSWAQLFTDRAPFRRLLIFCGFFIFLSVALLIVAFFFFNYAIKPETIKLEPNGTLTISGLGQPTRYILLLPASQRWFETGVFLKSGQRAHIITSGRVHLSINGLVLAANRGTKPIHSDWNGPNGLPEPKQLIDVAHQAMWVSPNAPLGSVLAYVSVSSDPHSIAHPPGVVSIKAEDWIQGEGKLWLTVNDMVLEETEENRKAYITTPEILRQSQYSFSDGKPITVAWMDKRWHQFVQDRRFDAFFDDNLGEFLVQITIEK